MTDREKLIDLLCKAHSKAVDEILSDDITYAQQLEIEADLLLANGVTFQKWIPVTERLPNPGERVIVRYETACSNLDRFRLADMFFDIIDNKPIWDYLHLKITHWMPMLEPPADDLK